MSQQFEDVDCKYGAPAGRTETPPTREITRLILFKVRFVDGDYDDGGAYWGGPPSLPLFCARGDGCLVFVRAENWDAAAMELCDRYPWVGFGTTSEYDMEFIVDGYQTAATWSSTVTLEGEEDPVEMDSLGCTWSPEAEELSRAICALFVKENAEDLAGMDPGQIGHDLWLTSAGHGVGFWDRGLGDRGDRLSEAAKEFECDIDADGKGEEIHLYAWKKLKDKLGITT